MVLEGLLGNYQTRGWDAVLRDLFVDMNTWLKSQNISTVHGSIFSAVSLNIDKGTEYPIMCSNYKAAAIRSM
eukprot:7272897-Karenia_brevis.AAC.1